jgi:AraC-like DNA-binding protein
MTTKQRNQIAHGLSASRADCDLTTLVRRSIAASLVKGHPTIAQAAEAADMCVRTLQRRLLDFGLTYSQLLDEVRLETACRLLERSETSLAEIATAMGYADPASFTRAFQRWTGETPSAFRRRIRQGCRCRS